jgi:uncharacterized protein (TIGR03435 family)
MFREFRRSVALPVIVVVIGNLATPIASFAQQFEVATIKPTPEDNAGNGQPSITMFLPGGGFHRTNSTLKQLVRIAYGVQDFQVSGGPNWADGDRFDVEAKSESNASRDQVLLMIQALLKDRFKLKIRRDTKEGSIYTLLVGKNGSRLQSVPESEPANVRINRFMGKRSMTQFAEYLSSVVGQPVVDKTALSGFFDIKLEFTPEQFRGRTSANGEPPRVNGESIDANGPSIFTAIQEQLGLRREPAKGTVQSLIIESAERPTDN